MKPTNHRTSIISLAGIIFTSVLILSACGPRSNGIIDNNEASSIKLSIPYEKYVLNNGLTVILHEDHSDPVAHVDVTYHVGSAREELGRSGFAHLFEHMMFQGSENVADEEHIKAVTEAGGTMNGTTNRDRTNYFETVPANHLESMLWLEADRMGFFLNAITQEKFEVQRATVKNEKQQNYDNRAYGRASELITKALYPYGHPYSWLTIGDLEDLDAATAEDLRNFFLHWYGPNNATLTIGGDIDPEKTLALIKRYFGGIASGPQIKPLEIEPFTLNKDRYVSYYDDKIRFPAVTASFPTVPKFHPDAPALQCLAGILGEGKGSYLYQNLVAPQKAIQASASHRSDELAGEFFMFVLPFPGQTLSDFETELRNTLAQFEENGVADEDLEKFKARYETGFIHGLEKVSGKVSQLAYYQTFANDAGYVSKELSNHLAVTKEDVMRVYNTYIKNKPVVILSVLADPKGAPAKPDNYKIPQNGTNPYPVTDYSGLSYERAQDDFDRTVQPAAQPAKLVNAPNYWTAQSANGVRIIGTESRELPKVSIRFSMQGGWSTETADSPKLGIAGLTTSMLNTSTQNFSEVEIAEELEKIGSQIYVSADGERFNIDISSLSKHLDRTLELLEEKLMRPAFDNEDFARLQLQSIESAKSSTKEASSIANMAYNRLIYGDTHSFGIPDTHLIPTLANITAADTREFYEAHFSPENSELVVVGDIDQKSAMRKLAFIFNWDKKAPAKPEHPKSPTYDKTTLFFIDKADAAQSEIRIGYLGDIHYDATGEYFKRQLMNFTLGGAFNSRINLNLREEKGLTYGARTWFEGSDIPGPFTASTSVKAEGTSIGVSEIMKEIQAMAKHGINDDELSFLQQAIGQRDALKYESGSQKSAFLGNILHYDIAKDFVEQQKRIVSSITKADIAILAKQHLPIDRMIIVVVGDKKSVYSELVKLKYPIIELDEEGALVK